ncbi:radical SAM protein [bacterium]|nr:radical SAM protein [candidate division CSSED10-310 bacterium]
MTGRCGLGGTLTLGPVLLHKGEEPPLNCGAGSGAVFFSGCNARCVFCQNYQISQLRCGTVMRPRDLSEKMLALQRQGACNINWVTPTPQLPFALDALAGALELGLDLPLVYNTNGYIPPDTLSVLDGIVDIYLPDFKYGEDLWAESLSGLPGYVDTAETAIRIMADQVGPLKIENDKAVSGLLVRHLVLPNGLSGTRKVFRILAGIDPEIPVSVMAQYRPLFRAADHSMINEPLSCEEYDQAVESFRESALKNGYFQDFAGPENPDPFFPDFNLRPEKIFGD